MGERVEVEEVQGQEEGMRDSVPAALTLPGKKDTVATLKVGERVGDTVLLWLTLATDGV